MLRLISTAVVASIFCFIYGTDPLGYFLVTLATYFVPEALFVVVVILTISAGFQSQSK